jgi:hypothetical protein
MIAKRFFSVRKKAKQQQNIFSDAAINLTITKRHGGITKKSKMIAKRIL